MKKRIFENGIYYVLVGDYYVPELSLPNETRSIGRWGRLSPDIVSSFAA